MEKQSSVKEVKTVRIPGAIVQRLAKLTHKKDRDRSWLINKAIEEYLDREGV